MADMRPNKETIHPHPTKVKTEDSDHADPVIKILGEIGRWQMGLYIVTGASIFVHSWQMLQNKFLTYPQEFHCSQPKFLDHVEPAVWTNLSSPYDERGQLDHCLVFDIAFHDHSGHRRVIERPTNGTSTRKCDAWSFSHDLFRNTINERFDLVCGYETLPRLGQIMFFLGTFFGVFASGFVSDKYGRILAYRVCLLLWVVFAIGGGLANSFWLWCVCRFVTGGASIGYNTAASVYCVELAGLKWRSLSNALFRGIPFNLGYTTLGLLTYLMRDMVQLEIFIGCCGIPFFLTSLFMPESPRWLCANGRSEEAVKVLKMACRINGQPVIPADFEALRHMKHEAQASGNMWLALKFSGMRRNMLIMCFCWTTFSMAYFGLVYNIPPFNLNLFLAFSLPSLFGLPILFVYPYVENSIGRKPLLTGTLLFSGASLISLLITVTWLPEGVVWPLQVLALCGLSSTAVAFSVGYSFTPELFPTYVRGSALSLASTFARFGSILSPAVASIPFAEDDQNIASLIIYGVANFLAGLASIWLWPETKGTDLSDSLVECESRANGRNPWLGCERVSRRQCSREPPATDMIYVPWPR